MKIIISDHRKIIALQAEFNALFPYLKIEFLQKSNLNRSEAQKKSSKIGDITVADCRTFHNKGELAVNDSMTVAQMEDNFRDVYGLEVQLLRKSGKTWLETSVTSDWTLRKQNEEGKALSYKFDL